MNHKYWIKNRLQLIQWVIQTDFPEMTLVQRELDFPLWIYDYNHDLSLSEQRNIIVSNKQQPFAPFVKDTFFLPESIDPVQLLDETRELSTLLTDQECTALIGLNDHIALKFLLWARILKSELAFFPTIIGFDNALYGRPFSLSSVDFNHWELGHMMADFVVSHPHPPFPQGREYTSEPLLIDRGSVRSI